MLQIDFALGYLQGVLGSRCFVLRKKSKRGQTRYINYVKERGALLGGKGVDEKTREELSMQFKEYHRGYKELSIKQSRYWEEISIRYGYQSGLTGYISSRLRAYNRGLRWTGGYVPGKRRIKWRPLVQEDALVKEATKASIKYIERAAYELCNPLLIPHIGDEAGLLEARKLGLVKEAKIKRL